MADVSVSLDDLRKLERSLDRFASRSLPYAVRNGLNTTAFTARKEWVDNQLPKAFTLRNKYTARSIRVDKATGRNLLTMQARVGSVLDYMGEQEEGFTTRRKGKHGVAIPTSAAAGQGKKRIPRTRTIRQGNYLAVLNVAKTTSGARRRRNAVAIILAGKTGGVAFLDLGRRKGLFRVTGAKRGFRIRMLYDLSKATTKTKAHPTLQPTLDAVASQLPAINRDALLTELRKQRILGY